MNKQEQLITDDIVESLNETIKSKDKNDRLLVKNILQNGMNDPNSIENIKTFFTKQPLIANHQLLDCNEIWIVKYKGKVWNYMGYADGYTFFSKKDAYEELVDHFEKKYFFNITSNQSIIKK